MRPSRFSEEQIIGILREQEAGAATADVCRKHGISSATFYKWKAKYGGLEISDARRLKALDDENRRLNKQLAAACKPESNNVSYEKCCVITANINLRAAYCTCRVCHWPPSHMAGLKLKGDNETVVLS